MLEPPPEAREPYSPHSRTALVLVGTGTAGAYHAGVLKALTEAGVKIDVVAGRGIGVTGALFAAVDGAARLWEAGGLWRGAGAGRLYGWQPLLRTTAWAMAIALAVVLVPFAMLALGLLVYPLSFLLRVAGASVGSSMVAGYSAAVTRLFDPQWLPDVLPRAFILALAALAAVLGLITIRLLLRTRGGRSHRGSVWWQVISAPLDLAGTFSAIRREVWRLVAGAAGTRPPAPAEFSRAYTELVADNLGQPGFRELVLAVHDLDLRRDVLVALLSDRYRREFLRQRDGVPDEYGRAETIDLAGVGRDHLADTLAASLSLPIVTEASAVRFAPESSWRGEVHRLADRPGATTRLLRELPAAGVEQVIVATAVSEVWHPHELVAARLDLRGRIGDVLAGDEAASVRDAVEATRSSFRCVFVIRPDYNPVGPLDFRGCRDARSDRHVTLAELVDRGYEDAYRQFIDPVVGASGEHIEAGRRRR